MCCHRSTLDRFARLLTQAKEADLVNPPPAFSRSLVRLGFEANQATIALLASLQIRCLAPLHLDVARKVTSDSAMRHRLRGLTLEEFLIDLLGFEQVRPLLSRRFFTAFRGRPDCEESIWWAAAHLNEAMQASLLKGQRIDSVGQLLCEGQRAIELLRRKTPGPSSGI